MKVRWWRKRRDSAGNPCPAWCRWEGPHWHDEAWDASLWRRKKHLA